MLALGLGLGLPFAPQGDGSILAFPFGSAADPDALGIPANVTFTATGLGTRKLANGTVAFGAHNLLLQSRAFNTTWTATRVTVDPNAVAAPNGVVDADTIIETATGTTHHVNQSYTKAASALTYTCAVDVKVASGSRRLCVFMQDAGGTNGAVAIFDVTGGQVGVAGSTFGSGWEVVTQSIESLGSGWYRVRFTSTTNTDTTLNVFYRLDNATGTAARSDSYTGDGASGLHLVSARLARGTVVWDVETTTTAYYGPRLHWSAAKSRYGTICGEPGRTNSFTYSQEFDHANWTKSLASVTPNAGTSPWGTTIADRLIEDGTAASTHYAQQSVTTTAAAWTVSVSAKRAGRDWICIQMTDSGSVVRRVWFNASTGAIGTVGTGITAIIADDSNGFYRCHATIAAALAGANNMRVYLAAADNSINYNGDTVSGVDLCDAQCELGAFPTTRIPTTTATVARPAETTVHTLSAAHAALLSGEGTMVVEFEWLGAGSAVLAFSRIVLALDDGTSSERIIIYNLSGNNGLFVADGGVGQATITGAPLAVGVVGKAAVAFKENDTNFALNGTAETKDTSCTMPTVTKVAFGHQSNSFLIGSVLIHSVKIYPVRRTDAQIAADTA